MPTLTKADAIKFLSTDGTSATIPETFTEIGDDAFINAFVPSDYGLSWELKLKEKEKWVEPFPQLNHVIITNSVKSIGKYAFDCCKYFVEIDLSSSSSLEYIDDSAFHECERLENLIS